VQDLAGGPESSQERRRPVAAAVVRRIRAWLIWWALLMTLWIIVDGSVDTDELLAGAGAAALAALLAQLAGHRAAAPGMPAGWFRAIVRLPVDVARDTWTVFGALARTLRHRQAPASAFRQSPVAYGAKTPTGRLRRAFVIGVSSFAPNSFALGIDADRDVMVVHQLDPQRSGGRQ
jgi:multisubunit Na+/H+ antiporter MnhE subunit